jgi:peptidoglycan/LPS O-acetylase OafA/YrhL
MSGRDEQAGNKLLGLEVLRFVAAFAVLVWHYQHFAFNGSAIDVVRAQQPLYALLRPFYEYGWYGVQIFWSISGFIFFWRYRDSVAGRTIDGRTFFVLRFSRLYPLHLLTLLLVAVLQALYLAQQQHYFVYPHNDGIHFLLQLFMASHWGFQQGFSFNGPIWSISVEVLVYLIFFASLRLAGKTVLLNLGAVALCVGLKVAGMGGAVSDCIGFFYAGGLAAQVYLRAPAAPLARLGLMVAVLGLPPLALLLAGAPSEQAVYFFLLAYLPLALYCLAQPVNPGPGWTRAIEAAGNMTYSSYLAHFPIQLAIALYFGARRAPIPLYDTSLLLFFLGSSALAAYLIYRYVELPAPTLLRRRLGARRAAPVAAP